MKKLEIDYRRAETFGALLLQARRVRGVEEWRDVTLAEAAALIETSEASLSRWEQGKQKPSSRPVLRAISEALDIPYKILEGLWLSAAAAAEPSAEEAPQARQALRGTPTAASKEKPATVKRGA